MLPLTMRHNDRRCLFQQMVCPVSVSFDFCINTLSLEAQLMLPLTMRHNDHRCLFQQMVCPVSVSFDFCINTLSLEAQLMLPLTMRHNDRRCLFQQMVCPVSVSFDFYFNFQIMIVVLTIALTAFSRGSFSVHLPEADMTAPEIITYYGYPVEHHTTITADGYHLVLHRIPHGNKESNTTKNRRRPVVFLQHGFVGSSAVWLMNPPSQSAGFVFADAGFDVWMGNTRGNTYSFKHNSLTRNDREYWKFTFDEVSYYDLEAMIDKVLNVTRQTHVYYVAHSEGCVLMLAKLSIDPIFSSKVAKFFALGPMTSMEHVRGIVPFFANNFGRLIKVRSYAIVIEEHHFDEVSYYDLEAMIDKVLNVTRQTHVYYVAHSEGCVLMLAKLSIDPIFSSKVAKFFALGPMTSMEHVRGIVPFFANNFGRLIKVRSYAIVIEEHQYWSIEKVD
uniref:Abhydro_lipase domain-containing protein n=1 Tax=Ascaris lumbricoides TaxID=6252 RepID=A0A0M3INM6_ASCLU